MIASQDAVSQPQGFPYFPLLPREIQVMIWKNAIDKPGIHFLGVTLKRPRKEDPRGLSSDPGAYTADWESVMRSRPGQPSWYWNPPGSEFREKAWVPMHTWDTPSRLCLIDYQPPSTSSSAGCSSSFYTFENASKMSGLPVKELRGLLKKPTDIDLGDDLYNNKYNKHNKTITMDGANDVVYLKFSARDDENSWSKLPTFLLDLDKERRANEHSFNRITKIAVEVDFLFATTEEVHSKICDTFGGYHSNASRCIVPRPFLEHDSLASGRGYTCAFCDESPVEHGSEDWYLQRFANFLHAFPNLKEVFLVVPGDVDNDDDEEQQSQTEGHHHQKSADKKFYSAKGPVARTVSEWRERQFSPPQVEVAPQPEAPAVPRPKLKSSWRIVKKDLGRGRRTFWCPGGVLREPREETVSRRLATVVDTFHWWYVNERPEREGQSGVLALEAAEEVQFRALSWS
ncbi:hypothetical protein M406DRAFT_332573 [Cryphonectria parasitica EP155]|uniref:Uncharacterized protein n=1 Tax=Cryphonectria parasitica (strain ATCC 38755 / EP155) TaxID=660469 RepID=A0A9P5CLU2_CRYP1|nr:uncharacterized protein M406DRAFT_332573 [Cryphonectria parasitica EP155]KAF3762185.1 hypothetical protein M406DRAFT_332573 [Cryphonectria parasitica EP155]